MCHIFPRRFPGPVPLTPFVLLALLVLQSLPASETTGTLSLALPTTSSHPSPSEILGNGWWLHEKNPRTCRAFAIGNWNQVTSGTLKPEDFRPVSPPDLAAALGLATVYGPDTAGWFLSTGSRVLVRCTDRHLGYRAYSYASLAQVGWGLGVTRETTPTLRLSWNGNGTPQSLRDLLTQAVGQAPQAHVWLVAGMADFASLRGETLQRSPVAGQPLNATGTVTSIHSSGPTHSLFVALAVRPHPECDTAVQETLRRFFPQETIPSQESNALLFRVHCAPLESPTPLDPNRPVEAIWTRSYKDPLYPRVSSVYKAEERAPVNRAHFALWAIDSVGPYDRYPVPDLVDVQTLDPTLLADQKWATSASLVGRPLYRAPRLLLQRPVAEAIVRINQKLGQQGFRLKLYDAYRPLWVTQLLYRLAPEASRKGFLASPTLGSRHNRAAAVDCTIVDSNGRDLRMPSPYLCFDERAYRRTTGLDPQVLNNLQFLTRVMASEGFTTINEEWWHYDAPGWQKYPILNVPVWPGDKTWQNVPK
jgi:D-alanyl-D-alanine dipeptidase